MQIFPVNTSPLNRVTTFIKECNDKSGSFFLKEVLSRLTCFVPLPLSAVATIGYHAVAEVKIPVYLFGQISWNGKKIFVSKNFSKKVLAGHAFHIMRAVFALVFTPLAVARPKLYVNTLAKIDRWVKGVLGLRREISGVDSDIANANGEKVQAVPGLDEKTIVDKARRRSQMIEDQKAALKAGEPANSSPSATTTMSNHDAPPPPSARGKKSRPQAKDLFRKSQTYEDINDAEAEKNKQDAMGLPKPEDLGPVGDFLPPPPPPLPSFTTGPVASAPKKSPPPPPNGERRPLPPPPPGDGKHPPRARPKRQVVQAPRAANPKRRSQTVEERVRSPSDLAIIASAVTERRRFIADTIRPDDMTPEQRAKLRNTSGVDENEWDDPKS